MLFTYRLLKVSCASLTVFVIPVGNLMTMQLQGDNTTTSGTVIPLVVSLTGALEAFTKANNSLVATSGTTTPSTSTSSGI